MPSLFKRTEPDPTLLEFGQLMKKRRKKMHLDQQEVAIKLGRNQATINNWETGWTAPSLLDAIAWCQVLGMDLWPEAPGGL